MGHVRLFKHYIPLPYLLLGVLDFQIFVFSIYAGAVIRFGEMEPIVSEFSGALLPQSIIFGIVMLLGMNAMGAYRSRSSEGYAGFLLRTVTAFLLSGVALSVFFIFFPDQLIGRGVIALAAIVSFFLVWVTRLAFSRLVGPEIFMPKVMFLGAGSKAKRILDKVGPDAEAYGFTIAGFLPNGTEQIDIPEHLILEKPPHLSLAEYSEMLDIEEIVVSVQDRRATFPMDELLDCKLSGISVLEVLPFFEREARKVDIDLLHPGWFIFSDGFGTSAVRNTFERAFDLLVAAVCLFFTIPFLLLTVIAIKFEDGLRSSIFYSQDRVGLNGKTFRLYKFRSMTENAEKDGVAVWASKNDQRITKVGNFIRKVRIDELPQLYNILRGDMGFVGPRPERPQFVDNLSETIPFYKERHRVKPGLAGWAQLLYPYGDSIEDAKGKLEYDLYYVKNHSLLLDCITIVKTVEIVLFGKGR